ncbi:MAG: hypothetical protein IMZ61_08155 [Planctomycetes bacterium]|nr:hypothetical protein [Planctomycetota bacterium]
MTKIGDDQRESAVARWDCLRREGPSITEHILNIIKAGLNAAPFTGAIASLMSDYIPSSRARRLEDFARSIADDLDRLRTHVHEDYLLTDDFAFFFEKCFRGVAENPQADKIEIFRGILINAAIRTDIGEEEKEYFLNLANSLSVLHIRILKFMAAPERYLGEAGIPESSIQGGFSQFFPKAVSGVQLQVIRSAFGEMFRYGLINTDQTIFGTMTAGQGLELLRGRVSELGARFINFCMVPR